MFFSNSIANRKGFLPRPALFRGWTSGGTGQAGAWGTDTGRNLTGTASVITADVTEVVNGALRIFDIGVGAFGGGSNGRYSHIDILASRVWGDHVGLEFVPTHIRVPAVLYLGNFT